MNRARFARFGALAIVRASWGLEFDLGPSAPPFEVTNDVAVVSVRGPITHHKEWCFDSYDSIQERVSAALGSSAKSLLLEFDSPGGDVAGCYETARRIRSMAAKAGKPVYALANGMMASGAYALACAADYIACPGTSFVGSIGVIEMLVDSVQADRAFGLNFAVIGSGEHKADGNPHTELKESVLVEAKHRVDSLALMFFELVAESRKKIGVEDVRAFQARVFHGNEAVAAGLADGVETKEELLAMVATGQTRPIAAAEGSAMAWKSDMYKAAAEGDEDAKRAVAALNDDDGGDDKKPKGDGDDDAKADGDGDGDADKAAKADGDGGDDDAKAKAAKADGDGGDDDAKKAKAAKADGDGGDDDAKAVAKNEARGWAQIEAQIITRKLSAEHAEIIRSATTVSQAKKMLELIKPPRGNPAAAASVTGTRGQGTGASGPLVSAELASHIDRKMGISASVVGGGTKREGNTLELGMMTPEKARARLAELEGELGTKGGV